MAVNLEGMPFTCPLYRLYRTKFHQNTNMMAELESMQSCDGQPQY
jgi:hypothetical protein